MPEEHPLESLPEQLSLLTGAVARAGVEVAEASRRSVYRPSGFARMYLLQSAIATWRLKISRTKTHRFIFVYRKSETFVVMEAAVECRLLPSAPEPRRGAGNTPQWQVSYPQFLLTGLTDEEFSRFAPPDFDPAKTVVAVLDPHGQDLLGVEFGKKPRIRYSPGRLPGPVEQGKYSLRPLLNLIEAAQRWDDGDWPIAASRPPQDGGNEAVKEVLQSFAEAYRQIAEQLDSTPTVAIGDVDLARYRIASYSADITVKLNSDGELAQDADEEEQRVGLTLRISDAEPDVGHVVPALPVMEVRGDLYNSFFETLTSAARSFCPFLGLRPEFQAAASKFLETAREDTLIFFADNDRDLNIYLFRMRGIRLDTPMTLLFVGVFEQPSDTRVSWSVEHASNRTIVLFSGPGDGIIVQKEDARYFLRALENVKRWEEML